MRRIAVLILLVGVVLAPGAAQAAFPGANGRIAFQGEETGLFGYQIFSVRPDGTGLVNLSDADGGDQVPAWSADGHTIAFASFRSGLCEWWFCEIWVMNADGSGQTSLGNSSSDFGPAWSPSGQRLVFERYFETTIDPCCFEADLYTMNADGTGTAALLSRSGWSDGDPSWSPDGQRIVFEGFEVYCEPTEGCGYLQADVFVVNANGTGVVNLTNTTWFGGASEGSPDWSPNGLKIAYVTAADIWTMNPDGTGKQNVTNTAGTNESQPAWSPDGTKIAFVASDGDSEIWTMNADGSSRARVTSNTTADLAPAWQPLSTALYPRPGGGTPLQVPLVAAYSQCTTPNATHAPPLALGSCTPPDEESPVLTTSTIGKGTGYVRLDAILGDPSTPADEADLKLFGEIGDVRCAAVLPGCAAAGDDYTGSLLLRAPLRITDRQGMSGTSTTAEDNELMALMQCAPTADPTRGSTCTVNTTANALVPGFVREQKRTVLSAFSIEVKDPGPNGTGYDEYCPFLCGDGDEVVYARQGVFTP